jgi:hypothetical protein
MPAGTVWARPGASPEAEAAAGLPPGFFEDMARGASHKQGLVHAGRDWCDDPKCRWCAPHRPCPVGRLHVCARGDTHPWYLSCPDGMTSVPEPTHETADEIRKNGAPWPPSPSTGGASGPARTDTPGAPTPTLSGRPKEKEATRNDTPGGMLLWIALIGGGYVIGGGAGAGIGLLILAAFWWGAMMR